LTSSAVTIMSGPDQTVAHEKPAKAAKRSGRISTLVEYGHA
jgi:hypothetical protein